MPLVKELGVQFNSNAKKYQVAVLATAS